MIGQSVWTSSTKGVSRKVDPIDFRLAHDRSPKAPHLEATKLSLCPWTPPEGELPDLDVAPRLCPNFSHYPVCNCFGGEWQFWCLKSLIFRHLGIHLYLCLEYSVIYGSYWLYYMSHHFVAVSRWLPLEPEICPCLLCKRLCALVRGPNCIGKVWGKKSSNLLSPRPLALPLSSVKFVSYLLSHLLEQKQIMLFTFPLLKCYSNCVQ